MTLVAAFRCRNDGILLCADREEDNDISKRSIEKIYRIRDFIPCEVFIVGSGLTSTITNTCVEVHKSLKTSSDKGADILSDHRAIIESSLKEIYEKYAEDLKEVAMYLLVVVAPRAIGSIPLLYRTEGRALVPEQFYFSHGSGKTVSDYLADRLYKHGLDKSALGFLAAFIFREAANSSSGVGLGTDMVFINEGDKCLHFVPPDAVRKIETNMPSLADAIYTYWKENARVPEWLMERD